MLTCPASEERKFPKLFFRCCCCCFIRQNVFNLAKNGVTRPCLCILNAESARVGLSLRKSLECGSKLKMYKNQILLRLHCAMWVRFAKANECVNTRNIYLFINSSHSPSILAWNRSVKCVKCGKSIDSLCELQHFNEPAQCVPCISINMLPFGWILQLNIECGRATNTHARTSAQANLETTNIDSMCEKSHFHHRL